MNMREKGNGSQLTITEAVETLSNIADMEFDWTPEMTEQENAHSLDGKSIKNAVQWLQQHDPDTTLEVVKETFGVVLSYLKNFYKKEYHYMPSQQTTEGIKAIMVLVGEAAKKLDRYAVMFPRSKLKRVTQLKEYKRLQEFYLSRVARKVDEGILTKWIKALSQRLLEDKKSPTTSLARVMHSKHVFVDLESVKKDSEYELFFIRKDDGSRFFSSRIIRNIKLVCDFGGRIGEFTKDDPLESVRLWHDHNLHVVAQDILHAVAPHANSFYHTLAKSPYEGELVSLLNQTLLALMLCSNSHNLMHDLAVKSCTDYFKDFQGFLKLVLHSREYEKLIAYPPEASDELSVCFLDLTHALCHALYFAAHNYRELFPIITGLLQEAHQKYPLEKMENHQLWNHLNNDYIAMSKLMKAHANGSLAKILDSIEQDANPIFDPMNQGNIPSHLFNLDYLDFHASFMRIPSPTYQEFIHKAFVSEEFKGMLRSSKKTGEKFLIINFQDRTSWRELARCLALEELQKNFNFSSQLTIVTLPRDTEFFQQLPPYHQDNQTKVFLEHFKENLSSENSGFFYPPEIKTPLLRSCEGILDTIHHIFFGGKNVLTRDHRLDFIGIFYLFLELKLIELVKPNIVSFTCKDGVDTSITASGELYAFLKLLHQEKISKQELDHLNMMLYVPAIMVRERMMLPEGFQQMMSIIKVIESVKSEYGKNFMKLIHEAFGPFYSWDILNARIRD